MSAGWKDGEKNRKRRNANMITALSQMKVKKK